MDSYEIYDPGTGIPLDKYVLKNGKSINEFGLLKDIEILQSQLKEIKLKLKETASELEFMINKENKRLKAGICRTDLDPPDYFDYQTVYEAMK